MPYDVTADAALSKTVLFVGDSNMALGAAALTVLLTPAKYFPVFSPRPGMGIRGWAPPREADDAKDYWQIRLANVLAKVTPDAVVCNLGGNDASVFGTATTTGYSTYGQKIAWLQSQLPGLPVIWTNLPTSLMPASHVTGCGTINYALGLMDATPNLTVLDWKTAATGHPEYMKEPGNVHYSPAGYTAYAAFVKPALDALP